jgi:tryptophan-rich sensory protein
VSRPLLYAILACAIAAAGEGLFMGKDGSRFMNSLKQPAFALPLWAWSLIGVAYYAICFLAMYRLTSRPSPDRVSLGLLIGLMAANTFWNFIYFRLRDLRLAFWYSAVYVLLAVALLVVLLKTDFVTALAFAAYVLYLPYALLLFYRTWKLNVSPQHRRRIAL